ncbi:SMI1/KNR4 family protein [Neobacillus sp. NRS-1170]|uniref:SMI1/KNR4 family protein n=1 Tax=Neobacillus sp. NRS-1170 TaxID=3233898 RepID=UPI003D2A776B
MKQLWGKFAQWLELNCPEILETFNEAATEAEIAEAEQKMGLHFPKSFKELLLIHNGQRDEYKRALGNYVLLSLDEIVDSWQTMKKLVDNNVFKDFEEVEAVGAVKKEFWWNPCWIPIATNGAGEDICIDLDPDKGGTVGQIITFWHDWEERKVISNSLEAWFSEIIKRLKDGTYKLIEEDEEIVLNDFGFTGIYHLA